MAAAGVVNNFGGGGKGGGKGKGGVDGVAFVCGTVCVYGTDSFGCDFVCCGVEASPDSDPLYLPSFHC